MIAFEKNKIKKQEKKKKASQAALSETNGGESVLGMPAMLAMGNPA